VTDIDWRSYLQDVHIPQIPNLMRRRAAANRPADNPELPHRDDVLAVFDLQRTVATGSLVEHYLWLELARRPIRWPVSVANMVLKSPHYWWTERQDRADFIRTFMRRYAGCTEEELRKIVAESVTPSLQRSLLIPAINQVEAHRAAGHRTILITGQIDIFVEPLGALFDEVISGAMDIDDDGRWSGHLAANPVVGEARAGWLRSYADATGMDLTASYAYGDSYADRPWLDEVGFPHAVNPDLQLYRYAQKRRWPTRTWTETLEGPVAPLLRSIRASL
jgi:HAD superfamily hydrolase (TIGR01490 family)